MLVLEYKFTKAGYVLLLLGCLSAVGGLANIGGLVVGGVLIALAFVLRRATFPCPGCKAPLRPERSDKHVQCKRCGHQVVLRSAA